MTSPTFRCGLKAGIQVNFLHVNFKFLQVRDCSFRLSVAQPIRALPISGLSCLLPNQLRQWLVVLQLRERAWPQLCRNKGPTILLVEFPLGPTPRQSIRLSRWFTLHHINSGKDFKIEIRSIDFFGTGDLLLNLPEVKSSQAFLSTFDSANPMMAGTDLMSSGSRIRSALFKPRKLIPFPGTNGYPKYDEYRTPPTNNLMGPMSFTNNNNNVVSTKRSYPPSTSRAPLYPPSSTGASLYQPTDPNWNGSSGGRFNSVNNFNQVHESFSLLIKQILTQ